MVREITMFREEHNEKVELVVAEGNNIAWLEKSPGDRCWAWMDRVTEQM